MSKITAQLTRLRVTIAALIVILLVLGVYSISQNTSSEGLPDLATTVVEITDVEKIVKADGNIVGRSERDVYFPSQGKVTAVMFEVGEDVSRGDVLAELEVTSVLGSTETVEVTAPIGGVITTINYAVNDVVYNSTIVAVRIVNMNRYFVEVGINENDVIDLEEDQTAKFIIPAISLDDKYNGKIVEIAPEPITTDGSIDYLVKLSLTAAPSEIKLGMSAEIEILADKVEDVFAIPENFLVERGDEYYVKRITWLNDEKTDYEVNEVEVELGLITEELVEVESGLRSGDELLEPSYNSTRSFSIFGATSN